MTCFVLWGRACLGVFFFGFFSGAASALSLVDLSTGINPDGTLTSYGAADPKWQLTAAPTGVSTGQATVVEPSQGVFANLEPLARWISPYAEASTHAPVGLYGYQMQFAVNLNLVSGLWIEGRYAADNRLIEIRLNGNLAFVGPNVSGLDCVYTGCEEFRVPTTFLINDPSWFVNGVNTLTVLIENQEPSTMNPTSFILHGTVNTAPVPEPATLILFSLGAAGIFIRERLRRVPKAA